MTKLSTLEGRVKRHLKHGNNFHCIYSKWDNNLGKIVRVTKTKRRSVLGFTILQLIVIAVRVWSIIFKSKSSTDRIIGTALTSVTLFGFIFRCDPLPDFIQMEFLNYIFCSRGKAKIWIIKRPVVGLQELMISWLVRSEINFSKMLTRLTGILIFPKQQIEIS